MLWYQPHSTPVAYTYLQPFGNFATGITWDLFKMNRDIFSTLRYCLSVKIFKKRRKQSSNQEISEERIPFNLMMINYNALPAHR